MRQQGVRYHAEATTWQNLLATRWMSQLLALQLVLPLVRLVQHFVTLREPLLAHQRTHKFLSSPEHLRCFS